MRLILRFGDTIIHGRGPVTRRRYYNMLASIFRESLIRTSESWFAFRIVRQFSRSMRRRGATAFWLVSGSFLARFWTVLGSGSG